MSHSSPAERLALRKASFGSNLLLPSKTIVEGRRLKLASTSSTVSTGSSAACSPAHERQVKSLTPDREFLVRPATRRVGSCKALSLPLRQQSKGAQDQAEVKKQSRGGANLFVPLDIVIKLLFSVFLTL